MRIFLTGATGVIGRRVIPALRARGHHVTAAGRESARLSATAQQGATPVIVDLFDTSAVRHAMAEHDVVINLATRVPPNSRAFLPGAWKEMDRIRREGARVVSEAAISVGAQRLIQESFAPIYPSAGDRWITELTPAQPAKYNRSVLDAEDSAMRFADSSRVGIILRFAFFYGLGDPFTRQLIQTVRKGWVPLLGRRDAYFPMVMHDDAAAAVVAALDVPGGIYNVVDDQPLTHQAIGEALAGILGVRPPRFLPAWFARLGGLLGDTLARSLRISNAKLKGVSRWTPAVPSAADGLRRAVAALTASGR